MSCPGENELWNKEFLLLCNDLYDSLIAKTDQLRKKVSAEAMLGWIEMVAGFASMHHPGRFADGSIENIALEIGTELQQHTRSPLRPAMSRKVALPPRKRNVLHVVTFVSTQGGHSRNLLNWIKQDQESHHSIIVTRQGAIPGYPALEEAVAESGGVFVMIPGAVAIIERARWIRQYAEERADLIVLHTIPNDVVPIVSFAAGCTIPVAFINNADHLFWLSSSVADTIINLREISIASSRECRFTRNDQLLPVPLVEKNREVGRNAARKTLGIPQAQTVLLTVGRALKYAPSPRQNFFRTARAILDRNKDAHLYLVGLTAEDHAVSSGLSSHERLHFVGPVDDATTWQKASDVYLEGFPFGSQTALLESVLPGVPCVRVYAPLSRLLAADDIALTGIVASPASEEAYIDNASEFLADREKAMHVGDILRKRVLRYHVDGWRNFLTQMYEACAKLPHVAAQVPRTSASVREVDLAISEYHGARYAGVADIKAILTREIHNEILGVAYNTRQAGFYRDSFQLLKFANQEKSWDRESLIFAAKLIPHRILYRRTGVKKLVN